MLQKYISAFFLILLINLSAVCLSQESFVMVNSWLCGKWEGNDKSLQAKYMISAEKDFFKGIALRKSADGSQDALEAIRIFKNANKWILMILNTDAEKNYYELRDFSTHFMMFERSNKSFPKKVSFYKLDDNLIRIAMEGYIAEKTLKKMEFYLYKNLEFNPAQYQVYTKTMEKTGVKL